MSETYFWTVGLEKTLESPFNCKEIKSVNPKGNQSWIFIGRTNDDARILWPPDAKNWLTGKDPDAGKDQRQEEKGTTKDEMVGWHHWLNGHEFEQAPRVRDGQGGLACCSPWGWKESDKERLNWTEVRNMAVRVRAVEKVPVKARGDGIVSPSSVDPEYHGAFILFTVGFQEDLSLDNIKSVQTWVECLILLLSLRSAVISLPFSFQQRTSQEIVSEARCHICLTAVAEIIIHRSTTLLIASKLRIKKSDVFCKELEMGIRHHMTTCVALFAFSTWKHR